MTIPHNIGEFQETLVWPAPPEKWPVALRALWFDAKGDWHAAHDLVDQLSDAMAKWVHAYLHRKEGDEWNARYWYRKAGKPFPEISLEEELKVLVEAVIRK
ncbi:MAG: hypothetical protein CMH48_00375 [Muricauda sp.]|nr:hypothetical protein [Allomuricauda sp.]MBC29275.1 hypothetical protein [Allomuricauda sp.]|tara:strand:- start:40669 stop:40971 length:303 start_codon:yes stop_codon:yes gene_type:complete